MDDLAARVRARVLVRIVAYLLVLSNAVGAPVSGLLLGAHWAGLPGWRWLFLLEGLPAIALALGGFVGPFVIGHLKDRRGGYARGLTALGGTEIIAAAMIFLVRPPRKIAV